jgi:hypothetical protein
MKYSVVAVLILSLFFLSGGITNYNTAKADEIDKTFSKKDKIKMKFVSGNCTVTNSKDELIHVKVIYNVSPSESFIPKIKESTNSLELDEEFHNSSSGDINWTLSVPSDVSISYSSASGNINIKNLKCDLKVSVASGDVNIDNSEGNYKISTASGNITSNNSKGSFKFSTASGNVNVENSTGAFKLSTASGNVDGKNITLDEKSAFNSASGNVYVKLSSSPKYNLTLSSASGNSVLDFNGNPMSGYFELMVKKNNGEIKANFKFDEEKEVLKDDKLYTVKSFKIDSDSPKIKVISASGIVELIK